MGSMGKMPEKNIGTYGHSGCRDASDNRNGSYKIYQLMDGKGGLYRFMGMDFIKSRGITVSGGDYRMVYSGQMGEGDTLDTLFVKFNIGQPDGFTGHSLSVSDVIVLENEGKQEAYYVDAAGFVELHGFVHQMQEWNGAGMKKENEGRG